MTHENPTQLFPMVVTNKLKDTKRFYTEAGFSVRFDMDEYLQVSYDGDERLDLCFMAPQGLGKEAPIPEFDGRGVVISIPTQNADEKYTQMKRLNAKLLSQPEDKPWGWRSFQTVDPNGLILDFFHVCGPPPAQA